MRKVNASNSSHEQIERILTEMIGVQSLDQFCQERWPQDTLLSRHDRIPDFLGVNTHSDHQLLVRKIARLKALRDSASDLVHAHQAAQSEFSSELADLDARCRFQNTDKAANLSAGNMIALGGTTNFAFLSSLSLAVALDAELERLDAERIAFNEGGDGKRGKKKNLKAYEIARMLAKFYFEATGRLPTYGTTEWGTPSTRYGEALSKIYQVVGLDAGIRGPAEDACRLINEQIG